MSKAHEEERIFCFSAKRRSLNCITKVQQFFHFCKFSAPQSTQNFEHKSTALLLRFTNKKPTFFEGTSKNTFPSCRLLQWEFDVLPTKVLKEDKAEYIQALIDTRESEDISVFVECMTKLHCQHLQADIDQFVKSTTEKVADKQELRQKMVDKWSIKPSLAEKMVDILEFVADKDQITTEAIVSHFGFNPTTAKRYLRQLTEFGYLEAHGGNKNRTYNKKS